MSGSRRAEELLRAQDAADVVEQAANHRAGAMHAVVVHRWALTLILSVLMVGILIGAWTGAIPWPPALVGIPATGVAAFASWVSARQTRRGLEEHRQTFLDVRDGLVAQPGGGTQDEDGQSGGPLTKPAASRDRRPWP